MKNKKILRVIKNISTIVDYFILLISILMFAIGSYAIWDTYQVYKLADKGTFEQYKPSPDNKLSYSKFMNENPDVIGWINIYGTGIDYPIVQSTSNEKYVNTSPDGKFSTAGSIFLDYRNKRDFTDFNSIIYGHHMDRGLMFGNIDKFVSKIFFDSHKYGLLYSKNHRSGLEIYALVKTTSSDSMIFTPSFKDEKSKENFIKYINRSSLRKRDFNISKNDRLVLLNTCTYTGTSGRYSLVARITDKVEVNNFKKLESNNLVDKLVKSKESKLLFWILLLIILLLYYLYRKNKDKNK